LKGTKPAPTAARGRPKAFDYEEALDGAMRVFWTKGYDGASLSDLTDAMGINRPSLYATFGNKEGLFQLTLERYAQQNATVFAECLSHVSARAGIDRLLREAAEAFAKPTNPGGCFSNQALMSCATATDKMQRHMKKMAAGFDATLIRRFERAVADGELPPGTSTTDLARYFSVVFQGLGLQARRGSTQGELHRAIDMAMRGWPT
jgi:AcrR family transcriptional regulator